LTNGGCQFVMYMSTMVPSNMRQQMLTLLMKIANIRESLSNNINLLK